MTPLDAAVKLLERDVRAMFTDLAKGAWQDGDEATLRLLAEDVARLAAKAARAVGPLERAGYDSAIRTVTAHAALLAYSRGNVASQQVSEQLKRTATIAVEVLVAAALAAV